MLQNQKKINQLLLEEKRQKARGFKIIAGIDEAGRGPLAGPVVAASVILKSFDFKSQIDDSKKLSSKARQKAYAEIVKKAYIGVGIVSEEVIDTINIYQATRLAMEQSVFNLRILPDLLLVDGNMRLRLGMDQIQIIKGDQSSLSIASASIVAKVTRDRLLEFYDRIFPGYKFASHKGYGTKAHMEVLEKKGFSPIHRTTFNSNPLKSKA